MERSPTSSNIAVILMGSTSDDLVRQCAALLSQRQTHFVACHDVYSAVACLALKRPIFLVLGRLSEMSKEDGRFFHLAARYDCCCLCLADTNAAPAQRSPQVTFAPDIPQLKKTLEDILDAPQSPKRPEKIQFDKNTFRTTEAELKAFPDAAGRQENTCRICPNMLDGIDAAAKERFSLIVVVMNGSPARLKAALRALHHVSASARIVLLAQMCQEPAARQLVRTEIDGVPFAADYHICPARFDSLLTPASIARPDLEKLPAPPIPIEELPKPPAPPPAALDPQIQMRIKELEKLATEDDLTGLKNRRYIWEFARQIIERAKRMDGRVTLLVFDIDDFKHYNDMYGHPFGDEILRQAALLMRRCCRTHDVVGRIGGDEFAVVFWDDPKRKAAALRNERRSTDASHPREAISVAKRFRNELGRTDLSLLGPAGKGILTISGGLASFPRNGSTPDELFSQADKALLDAKRSGKNRIYLVGKPESDIEDIG